MELGIIGLGILGGTYYSGYKHLGFNVKGYDKFKESDCIGVKELFDCDAIFICLPTICNSDGSPDLTPFDDVLPQLKDYKGVLFMRSTMMPGQTQEFNEKYGLYMIHCPEFLTEKKAKLDFFHPSRILIGVDYDDFWLDIKSVVEELFSIFGCPVKFGTTLETELAKVASNVFLATRIIFANEFDSICALHGVRWERVKGMMLDNRFSTHHMNVTREGGYSGMCLPKDTKQIISDSYKEGYNAEFLREVDRSNDRFRNH